MRRHNRQRTRGQSFVEFALILPVMLLFLAATLDLGRIFYANITLNNAAREGAFQAAKTPHLFVASSPCDQATNRIVCRVQNESTGSMVAIQPSDINVTCNPSACPEAPGATVTVSVGGQFRLITPILAFIFGGQTLQLSSSATAQIEYLPNILTATPPPTPVAEVPVMTSTTGSLPLTVTFDASNSTGDPSGFQWDFDGDEIVDSTDPKPSWTFTTAGTHVVTLTVINMTGVDVQQFTVTITQAATPTPDPGATPTPTPVPTAAPTPPPCVHPPSVIGQKPTDAAIHLQEAGFNNFDVWGDLSSGPKNKIQAQNPDATQCIALTDHLDLHYRLN